MSNAISFCCRCHGWEFESWPELQRHEARLEDTASHQGMQEPERCPTCTHGRDERDQYDEEGRVVLSCPDPWHMGKQETEG